jgi:hypothetical protein
MEQTPEPFAPDASASGAPAALSDTLPALAAQPPALHDSFDPVLLRYRHDGWTPARQRAFIEALADTLCVATAAARVGMCERSAYALRRRCGAGGFAAAWDAALRQGFRDRVRSVALDKAVNGTVVRRYYHGALIAEERVYSERLLLRLLAMGEKLFASDGPQSEEMMADWDGAMDRLESGALEGGYRVWRDRWGHMTTNFPPPSGFDNYQGEPTDPDFERPLSEAEAEALAAQGAARVADGEKARDLFFGFSPRGRAKDRASRLKGGR